VALIGLWLASISCTIGTEPIAAARCRGSWPRLSFTRAVALCVSSKRARGRLFLEQTKWRAVYDEVVGYQDMLLEVRAVPGVKTKKRPGCGSLTCPEESANWISDVTECTTSDDYHAHSLLALTSAPCFSSSSTSSSLSFMLDPICKGVHPLPSCAAVLALIVIRTWSVHCNYLDIHIKVLPLY